MSIHRWLSALLLLAAASHACAGPADAQRAAAPGADWPAYGRTPDEQRFSPLTQIDQSNVARLGLAWTQTLDHERGLESTPLVIDGVMYVTGAWSVVYAFDAASGRALWKYDPQVDRARGGDGCCGVVNRGVAAWQGRIFVGAFDGRLIALDAGTGTPVWSVQTFVDPSRPYTITGAPRVVKGKVLIGNGGAEMGVRGYLSAYDANTGELAWRFWTVPGDPSQPFESPAMAMAAKTWSGVRWWEWGGGGTVWDAISFDPELDLLYFGVGNGGAWARTLRSPGGGDNLFLSSIVAVRPDTGEYVWHYQLAPGEQWDYPATAQLTLIDTVIDGLPRKLLVQVPKHGFVYVIDRTNGRLLSAEPFTKVTWATGYDLATGRPLETPQADYSATGKATLLYPGVVGGHNWHPVSYHPRTGYLYFGELQLPSVYALDPAATWRMGKRRVNTGQDFGAAVAHPELQAEAARTTRGSLLAWDIVNARPAWRVEQKVPLNGGTLATAGGLVFQGATEGRLVAYAAEDGRVLWETPTFGGIPAGPVSYAVDGRQFIAAGIGWGGALSIVFPDGATVAGLRSSNRIAVYALDATGVLPPPPPQDRVLDPPPATAPMEQVNRGMLLYFDHCGICHGSGGGGVPDLGYMSRQTHADFAAIVLGGARADRGMPSFHEQLDTEALELVRAFLVWQANQLKAAQQATTGVPASGSEGTR